MATVQDLLDDLLAGRLSLDEVALKFAERKWPSPSRPTDAQAWGVDDDNAPDPDSWAAVNACFRLSPEQYATLAAAAASKDDEARAVTLDVQDAETFHLPGRHNQKNHGNRVGRPGNVAGKTGIGKEVASKAEAAMRAALGDKLNVADADTPVVKRHLRDLSQIPASIHKEMKDYLGERSTDTNSGVFVSSKAVPYITPESSVLKAVQPRGWPPGKTWDQVHGAFNPANRQVMMGDGPNHPADRGDGHESTARHEYGHAIQDVFRKKATFEDRATQAEAIADLGQIRFINPYFNSMGNPSGYQSELFAEMFSLWSGGYPIPVIRKALGMHEVPLGSENEKIQTVLDVFDKTFGSAR